MSAHCGADCAQRSVAWLQEIPHRNPPRFSSDVSTVDDSLPFILNMLLANTVMLIAHQHTHALQPPGFHLMSAQSTTACHSSSTSCWPTPPRWRACWQCSLTASRSLRPPCCRSDCSTGGCATSANAHVLCPAPFAKCMCAHSPSLRGESHCCKHMTSHTGTCSATTVPPAASFGGWRRSRAPQFTALSARRATARSRSAPFAPRPTSTRCVRRAAPSCLPSWFVAACPHVLI